MTVSDETAVATQRKATTKPARQASQPGRLADGGSVDSWTRPPLTLKDVRDAIPPHCFERSTLRSFMYVAHDLILIAALGFAATYIQHLPLLGRVLAWPAYWVAQGAVMTGIWILAHECGHQAFSPSATVNNVVGFILHSAVLVPFFSWKYTHSAHHKGAGHMDKDQAFVPKIRSEVLESIKAKNVPNSRYDDVDDNGDSFAHDHPLTQVVPIYVLYEMAFMVLFGWPAYLLFHSTGQKYFQWASHFNPASPMFDIRHRNGVILSNAGLAFTITILISFAKQYGASTVMAYYGIPYLFVNMWLVTITFLQHTDPKIPHYRGNTEWDFLRGALSTVDRDYGVLLNHFHHHIADTHVVHHLFSTMPHYHAQEATEAVKRVLGKYYMYDNTPIVVAFFNSLKKCRFVEEDGDVLWYKY